MLIFLCACLISNIQSADADENQAEKFPGGFQPTNGTLILIYEDKAAENNDNKKRAAENNDNKKRAAENNDERKTTAENRDGKNTAEEYKVTENNEGIESLIEELEADESVRSLVSYSGLFTKPAAADELASMLTDVSEKLCIDSDLIKMLCYLYFTDSKDSPAGEIGVGQDGFTSLSMTAKDFFGFLSGTALKKEAFLAYLDENMLETLKLSSGFSNEYELTKPLSSKELAEVFGINEETVKSLITLYCTEKGEASATPIALPEFADFVLNEVMPEGGTGSMLGQKTLGNLETALRFGGSDVSNELVAPTSCEELASVFGVNESAMKIIFTCCFANSDSFQPCKMALTEFVGFLRSDGMKNSRLSYIIGKDTKALVDTIGYYANKNELLAERTPAELAQIFGMDESSVKSMFMLYGAQNPGKSTVSIAEAVDYVLGNFIIRGMLDDETLSQLKVIQGMIKSVINGTEMTYYELAQTVEMDETAAKMIYALYDSRDAIDSLQISAEAVLDCMAENEGRLDEMMGSVQSELFHTGKELIEGSVNKTEYSAEELARLVGMSQNQVRELCTIYAGRHQNTADRTLSVYELADFAEGYIITDSVLPPEKNVLSDGEAAVLELSCRLAEAVMSGREYTAEEMYRLLSGADGKIKENAADIAVRDVAAETEGSAADGIGASRSGASGLGTVEFLYIYAKSQDAGLSGGFSDNVISIEDFFEYISEEFLNVNRYENLINQNLRDHLTDAGQEYDKNKAYLASNGYCRLLIASSYAVGSKEMAEFIKNLNEKCGELLSGDFYLVGSAATVFEMQENFKRVLRLTVPLAVLIIAFYAAHGVRGRRKTVKTEG